MSPILTSSFAGLAGENGWEDQSDFADDVSFLKFHLAFCERGEGERERGEEGEGERGRERERERER